MISVSTSVKFKNIKNLGNMFPMGRNHGYVDRVGNSERETWIPGKCEWVGHAKKYQETGKPRIRNMGWETWVRGLRGKRRMGNMDPRET